MVTVPGMSVLPTLMDFDMRPELLSETVPPVMVSEQSALRQEEL